MSPSPSNADILAAVSALREEVHIHVEHCAAAEKTLADLADEVWSKPDGLACRVARNSLVTQVLCWFAGALVVAGIGVGATLVAQKLGG